MHVSHNDTASQFLMTELACAVGVLPLLDHVSGVPETVVAGMLRTSMLLNCFISSTLLRLRWIVEPCARSA